MSSLKVRICVLVAFVAYEITPLLVFLGYRINIYSGLKQMCNYNTTPLDGIACNIDVRSFGPCVLENLYGYHRNAPCVFLTLKEMFGWTPEYYNDTELLPQIMPRRLRQHIEKVAEKNKKMVWICLVFLKWMLKIKHFFSWTLYGCRVMAYYLLIRNTLDRSSIIPFKDFQAISIHIMDRMIISVHWWRFI